MKNQFLLVITIFFYLTSCRKNSEEIKKDAESFLLSVKEQKKISKTFFQLLGVNDSIQATLLKVGEPIPIILLELKNVESYDIFKDKIDDVKTEYFLVPFMLDGKQVSQGYFSRVGEMEMVSPVAITPAKCGTILKPNAPNDGPSGVPSAVNPHCIYSDFENLEIVIYKIEGQFYGIPLRNSFISENNQYYELIQGKKYDLKTIQQILKKKLVDKKVYE